MRSRNTIGLRTTVSTASDENACQTTVMVDAIATPKGKHLIRYTPYCTKHAQYLVPCPTCGHYMHCPDRFNHHGYVCRTCLDQSYAHQNKQSGLPRWMKG